MTVTMNPAARLCRRQHQPPQRALMGHGRQAPWGQHLFAVLALTGTASGYDCTGKPRTVAELLEKWFGGNASYDKGSRPNLARRWLGHNMNDAKPPEAAPETIWSVLQVMQLKEVDTRKQTFRIETQVRVFWYDFRLVYDPDCIQLDPLDGISFAPELGNAIWKPDLYFKEDAEENEVILDGFWIAPSGRVWWSRKMYMTLACRMSFTDMPFDTQRCLIHLTGYQHTAPEIQLRIPYDMNEPGSSHASAVTAPAYIYGPIRAACQTAGSVEWQMTYLNGSGHWSASGDSVVSNSFIEFELHLTRNPSYFMTTSVIPTILVVCIAWSSFFISRSAVPARVAVTLFAFLIISGMRDAVLSTLPRNAGKQDPWIVRVQGLSGFMIFAAVLEYALANFLMRIEGRIASATKAAKKRLADARAVPVRPEAVQVEAAGRAAGAGDVVVQVEASIRGDDSSRRPLGTPQRLLQEVRQSVPRVDGYLLVLNSSSNEAEPEMVIRDQHLDVFCAPRHPNPNPNPNPQPRPSPIPIPNPSPNPGPNPSPSPGPGPNLLFFVRRPQGTDPPAALRSRYSRAMATMHVPHTHQHPHTGLSNVSPLFIRRSLGLPFCLLSDVFDLLVPIANSANGGTVPV